MSRQDSTSAAAAGPEEGASAAAGRWYLSFDCATKSFAYALVRVGGGDPAHPHAERLTAALAARDMPAALAAARALDAATRGAFHLAAGGARDLVPGKPDAQISTVERVRAVQACLRGPVAAALAAAAAEGCPPPDSAALRVAIEFQMGVNAPARTVAAVLVAEYAAADVFLVGPAYKNKLWYPSRPELRHCFYAEKYSSLYTANKNHAKDLYYGHLAPLFGHRLPEVATAHRKDFADSVVQVLGFLAFGDSEKAAEKF